VATRFSASEARLKAESAQKSLEELRKTNEELKKSVAKERALIKQGFEQQREKVISAAIDGNTELVVDSVYLFSKLTGSGIQVVEEGLVRKRNLKINEVIELDGREKIKEQILEHFDTFIDASTQDLKHYYGGLKRFHRQNYNALYEVITSEWNWDVFYGDDVYSELVPDDLKSKYFDYFEKINDKIKEYKSYDEDLDVDDDEGYDDDQLVTGEYCFSDDDDEVDLLKSSVEGNKLKIRWTAEEGGTHMNDPLLSGVGLAWLSTYRGQNLIEEIFGSLSSAAEMGKTNLRLDFSLTRDGWLFVVGSRKVFCCMPDELVEVIIRENFTINDIISTQKSYAIKVSW
jgi:hypothetical protein